DKEVLGFRAASDPQFANAEPADQGRPARGDAQFAIVHRKCYEIRGLLEDGPLGRDDDALKRLAGRSMSFRRHYSPLLLTFFPAFMRSACCAACSMGPTYMKAPSGKLSHLPSQISSKLRMVSASGVTLPGLFVNASATRNGCDRNRSMRRARFTTCLSSS